MRLALLAREVRYDLRIFRRDAVAASFTVAFPFLFLVLLNLVAGELDLGPADSSYAQRFTPGIAVFGLVTAVYTNLAIRTAIDRDEGVLKRVRGTPLPPSIFLAGRIVAAAIVGLMSVVIMLGVGITAFDLRVRWEQAPIAVLLLATGAVTFAALALAIAAVIPNGRNAPALVNATILPLALISDVFFPISGAPNWVGAVADLLPLRPLVVAFADQLDPGASSGFPMAAVLALGAWAAVGLIAAIRWFRWQPHPGRRIRQGRRA